MKRVARASAAVVALLAASMPARAGVWASGPSSPPSAIQAFAAVQGSCCGSGTVVAFSPETGAVSASIDVGGTPTDVAVTPDGGAALVSNTYGYVSVIDTATDAISTTIPVCTFASAVAVNPAGTSALVTCAHEGTVEPINLTTETLATPIVVGRYASDPDAVAIAPDGSTAYVIDYNSPDGITSTGAVVPIDMATMSARPPITLSDINATSAAMTPDGRSLLVAVWGTSTSGSAIDFIDTATGRITATRSTPSGPTSVVVTADGSTAFVACHPGNAILPISLTGGSVPAARYTGAQGLALTPDGSELVSATGAQEIDRFGMPDLHFIGYTPTDSRPVSVAVAGPPVASALRAETLAPSGLVEGVAYTGLVGHVAGGVRPDQIAVDWGDGAITGTTVDALGGIRAQHTYAEEGAHSVTISVTDAGGTSALSGATFNVTDAPIEVAALQPVSASEGQPWSGRLATYTDNDPQGTPSDLSGLVDWGDGTKTAAQIDSQCSCVSAAHTYAQGGSYAIRVTVADAGGAAATVQTPATVSDPPLSSAGGTGVGVSTASATYSGPVASFTDADTTDSVPEYVAQISWGDGETSSADQVTGSAGRYTVLGTHTYQSPGKYSVVVTVIDGGGSRTQATTTIMAA